MTEPPPPTLEDVEAAASAIAARVHRTPLLRSRSLGEAAGAPVTLKAELLQRTGSFKIRGALNRVDRLSADERRAGVITVSAGNHAQAVALACATDGVDALVLMPRGASEAKVAATRGYGATVDLDSRDAAEAFARVDEIAATSGRVVLHPFDDPHVIAGQGTVGLEICQDDGARHDTIVVPVGGGGLLSGIVVAAHGLRPGVRIVGVQPHANASLARSLAAGHPVGAEQRPTLADGLAAPAVGRLCVEVCSGILDEVAHVGEDDIVRGMQFLYERAKLAAEPAGAAAVAALLTGLVDVRGRAGVVAVVSGGNTARAVAAEVLGRDA